jgi:hypothetical protein
MASSSSKKPKQSASRFAWDGIPNIFNWIQLKIQFESNLTLKEKEYLFQCNAEKILAAKNRLESGIDYEYKRALMRKVIEISDDIKQKKILELTQDVEENIFLPYLWSNRQWNPSVEKTDGFHCLLHTSVAVNMITRVHWMNPSPN